MVLGPDTAERGAAPQRVQAGSQQNIMSLSEAQHRQHKQIKQLHLPPCLFAISVLRVFDQSPVSRQKVSCCNSWEFMNLTAISDPVLLHGPRRKGRTSVWLGAYLRNCATLAIKAPAPGCSTFPECKDTIPVNWLHSPHRH